MTDLNHKIKNTALFTPEEKIEILTAIDTFSQSDKTQLGDIIDEYDHKFAGILSNFKQNMISQLSEIEKKTSKANLSRMREAVEKIKSGLDVVAAPPTS